MLDIHVCRVNVNTCVGIICVDRGEVPWIYTNLLTHYRIKSQCTRTYLFSQVQKEYLVKLEIFELATKKTKQKRNRDRREIYMRL